MQRKYQLHKVLHEVGEHCSSLFFKQGKESTPCAAAHTSTYVDDKSVLCPN